MQFKLLSTLVVLFLWAGCTPNKQMNDELPFLDTQTDYPVKEISLTDIADITYLHLDADDDDFFYNGRIDYATSNTLLVVDGTSQSVLFFSKDGKPKSRFNRLGQGPEEYANAAIVLYDEGKDEVYIMPDFMDHIKVYSSSGEYKRQLNLPQRNILNQIAFFDDQSLLVYENNKVWQNTIKNQTGDNGLTEQMNDSAFFRMSRADGTILEYISLPSPIIDLSCRDFEGGIFGQIGYARVRKSPDGLLLYNPESDTIFLYGNDKSLVPYMHKKPLLRESSSMTVMDICMDAGLYQFMAVYPYVVGEFPIPKYYMRDKATGEIFRQKITLPDYQGKEITIDPRMPNYYEKAYHFELDFIELKEAYQDNKLSGRLKELVSTFEEEGNNVIVFVDFNGN